MCGNANDCFARRQAVQVVIERPVMSGGCSTTLQNHVGVLMISTFCELEIPCEQHCAICDKTESRTDLDITSPDLANPASSVFRPTARVLHRKTSSQA